MTTFVLIPGAGGVGAYWNETVAALESLGHVGIAVDIREDDPSLGLPEFAAVVDDAIGTSTEVVVVAQSMGGFTAPMLGKRDAVARIVFLNAMIPTPGETPGEWFDNVEANAARVAAAEERGYPSEYDDETYFLHDIPEPTKSEMFAVDRGPADTAFGQPCTFETWPDVPLHVLVGADDRMFPIGLQQRVARERLDLEADVMPGGHLVAKSRPAELAERLVAYLG